VTGLIWYVVGRECLTDENSIKLLDQNIYALPEKRIFPGVPGSFRHMAVKCAQKLTEAVLYRVWHRESRMPAAENTI